MREPGYRAGQPAEHMNPPACVRSASLKPVAGLDAEQQSCVVCPLWRQPANTTQRGQACEPCRAHLAAVLSELPGIYAHLHASLGEVGGGDERITRSREAPIPYRTDIHDLLDAIADTVWKWEQRIRKVARLTPAQPGRPGETVAAACKTLTTFIVALFAHPDGVQAAHDINHLHQHSRRVLGLTQLRHRLEAPCPHCDIRALMRDNGTDHVYCDHCGTTYPHEQYKFLTRVLIHQHGTRA